MAHQVNGVVAEAKGAPVKLVPILVPDPGPGEALVRVKACGVCHTDLHYREGAINDRLGPFPILVLADAGTQSVHTYLRLGKDEELEFELRDGRLVDRQTGSVWDVARGIAVEGPLTGTVLQQVPYMTSFDWAWEDFYPHTEIYQGR